MPSSLFHQKWGVRLTLFIFLVAIWFGLQAYRRLSSHDEYVPRAVPATAPTRSVEEIRAAWRQDVERILKAYEQDRNATSARDTLLGLTVAREDQDAHLRLVLALNAVVEGVLDADKKWQAAKTAFEQR